MCSAYPLPANKFWNVCSETAKALYYDTQTSDLGAGAVTDEQPLETAELFRERAKELRTIADGTGDRVARKALLEVADNYERRAGQQERV